MVNRATLKIECKDPETLKKSLLPDVKSKEGIGIRLRTRGRDLILEIESEKISYLKAVINSYLSLIKTLEELGETEW